MRVLTTTQVDAQQWDSLAKELDGGYYHCHAPVVAVAKRTGSDPLFVTAVDTAGRCIGLVAGRVLTPFGWPFSRRCRTVTLLSLPSTTDKSSEAERAVMEAVEARLRSEGVYLLNIASYASPNAQQVLSSLSYELTPRSEFYLDVTRSDKEIWDGLAGERRTDIRYADKHGVHTRIENTEEALELVYSFFEQSMRRHNVGVLETHEHTRQARREHLKSGQIDVFLSHQNATPVNGAIFGSFNGKPYYAVSGASPEGYKCRGPSHLIWTAIKTYQERGATCLNLGAAVEGQGVYRFKRDFGATAVPQPTGKKILSTLGARLLQARALLRRRRS